MSATTNSSVYPRKVSKTEPWDLQILQFNDTTAACFKHGRRLGSVVRTDSSWKMTMTKSGRTKVFESPEIDGVFLQVVGYFDKRTTEKIAHVDHGLDAVDSPEYPVKRKVLKEPEGSYSARAYGKMTNRMFAGLPV